jgi:hypothetical protein
LGIWGWSSAWCLHRCFHHLTIIIL